MVKVEVVIRDRTMTWVLKDDPYAVGYVQRLVRSLGAPTQESTVTSAVGEPDSYVIEIVDGELGRVYGPYTSGSAEKVAWDKNKSNKNPGVNWIQRKLNPKR